MIWRYLAFLLCMLPAALIADAVRLRSGEIVVGTITAQTRDDVTIIVNGKTRVIRKTDIQRVVYGSAEAEVKKAEEQRRLWEELRRKQELAKAEKDKAQAGPGLAPFWKSALLPGWGQYASGYEKTGIGTASLMGLTAIYVWQRRASALSAKNNYDSTSTLSKTFLVIGAPAAIPVLMDSSAKETYTAQVHRYNQSLNLLALIYVAQIAHSFLLTRAGPAPAAHSMPPHAAPAAVRPALANEPVPAFAFHFAF